MLVNKTDCLKIAAFRMLAAGRKGHFESGEKGQNQSERKGQSSSYPLNR